MPLVPSLRRHENLCKFKGTAYGVPDQLQRHRENPSSQKLKVTPSTKIMRSHLEQTMPGQLGCSYLTISKRTFPKAVGHLGYGQPVALSSI